MPELFDSRYFRGQGKLFIGDRDVNGNITGLIFIGDLSSANLTANIDKDETIENVSGSNAIASSFIKKSQFDISIAMRSIKPDHLAIALHGANTAKAGASVTDEAATCYLDKFTKLEHNKVSAVTITNVGASTTYIEGTDYIVHADEGLIEFISGGTITDALPVLIDYTYAAQHHIKIAPNNLEKALIFAGINSADNDKQTRCELYKVKLSPGVLSLITDATTDMPITGTVLQDTTRVAGDQFYSWKTED